MPKTNCSLKALVLLIAPITFIAGCGDSRDGMVRIYGVVTYDGAPVESGNVTFQPVAGGRPSLGEITADGSYELSTWKRHDGASLGEHKVGVKVVKVKGGVRDGGYPEFVWIVPQRYSDPESSGLTAVVEGPRSQEINFDIKGE